MENQNFKREIIDCAVEVLADLKYLLSKSTSMYNCMRVEVLTKNIANACKYFNLFIYLRYETLFVNVQNKLV